MLNSHQILKGARTKGGIKTYVDAEYVGVPGLGTNTAKAIDFTGAVELDGVVFYFTDAPNDVIDLTTFEASMPDGEYILHVVPRYDEPADRATAEGLGLNYFVDQGTPLGESIVHYFLPAALEAEMSTAGGYTAISKAVYMGSATPGQINLFNRYSDQLERLSDPRYTGHLLEPVGLSYVLQHVFPQDNRSKTDALVGLSNVELQLFLATQGYVAANRVVDTLANAEALFETTSIQAKVKRAFGYASLADAEADVNGVEIKIKDYDVRPTIFSSPLDLDDNPITPTHVAVFEYYQPTYMSRGHEGRESGILDLYTKDDATIFGRINPLYMARDFEVARVSAGRGKPLPALTKYAHPLPVAKFTKTGALDFTVNGSVEIYTPGKLDLVG